jgi:hypothetical protein
MRVGVNARRGTIAIISTSAAARTSGLGRSASQTRLFSVAVFAFLGDTFFFHTSMPWKFHFNSSGLSGGQWVRPGRLYLPHWEGSGIGFARFVIPPAKA